jgi:HlyD family secretion protein
MNKKLLVGIAGAVIVAIAAGALLLGGTGNAAPGKYTYETVKIDKGDVARVVTASGAVNPREKVEVGSEVSGKVTAIFVDFNDVVKKNQVLAQVDPETFQNTLDQNRARLQQAQASVDSTRASISRAKLDLETQGKTYERTKVLFNEGATSKADWEQAEQAYKNAQLDVTTQEVSLKSALAGLETARATVQDSITKLERTKIRSPIDGVILSRDVEVGQTVQSAQSVAKFFTVAADLSQIEIEANVVESDIGGINIGDPVAFTVDAFAGERFQGSVVQVRQLGTETANVVTYTVVINARNPNGRLLPGEDRLEGLQAQDIDGDGYIVNMRVPDPKGEWKKDQSEPRLMIQREPPPHEWQVSVPLQDRSRSPCRRCTSSWCNRRGRTRCFDEEA